MTTSCVEHYTVKVIGSDCKLIDVILHQNCFHAKHFLMEGSASYQEQVYITCSTMICSVLVSEMSTVKCEARRNRHQHCSFAPVYCCCRAFWQWSIATLLRPDFVDADRDKGYQRSCCTSHLFAQKCLYRHFCSLSTSGGPLYCNISRRASDAVVAHERPLYED